MLAVAVGSAASFLSGAARAADLEGAPRRPGPGEAFEADTLADHARARAAAPYATPKADDLPGVLKDLDRERYAAIRAAPGRAIWAGEALGYELEPLLRGSIHANSVPLYLIENGLVRPVAYDGTRFSADGIELPDLPGGRLSRLPPARPARRSPCAPVGSRPATRRPASTRRRR